MLISMVLASSALDFLSQKTDGLSERCRGSLIFMVQNIGAKRLTCKDSDSTEVLAGASTTEGEGKVAPRRPHLLKGLACREAATPGRRTHQDPLGCRLHNAAVQMVSRRMD